VARSEEPAARLRLAANGRAIWFVLLSKEESRPDGGFSFFYSIKLRITGSEEKTANFVWVVWRVSGLVCGGRYFGEEVGG
jgi:hypothetical protein